jgi:hypothetical protein
LNESYGPRSFLTIYALTNQYRVMLDFASEYQNRPDAISQSSKKPPMMAKRTIVTPRPRMESMPPGCATAASDAVATRESSWFIFLDIEIRRY